MTPFEISFVAAVLGLFCALAAVIAWGWYQTKDLPRR